MRMICFAVLTLFAAHAVQAATTSTNASDPEITRYIQQRFERDPFIFSPRVKVQTTNGRVVVSGKVATLGEERRALNIAEATAGVREVVDQVEVDTSKRPDSEILSDVESAFTRDPAVDGFEIDADVKNGIVILTGKVQSLAERDLALRSVWFIQGVRAIENEIQVRPLRERPDDEIAADVRGLLRADARMAGTPLRVAVEEGRVALSGIVRTPTHRAIAANLAQVAGVREVDVSSMVVNPGGVAAEIQAPTQERQPVRAPDRQTTVEQAANADLTVAERDAMLQQAMGVFLSASPHIDARNVKVRIESGTAYLDGVVGTIARRTQIVEALRNLGVARIVDKLQVAAPPEQTSPDVATATRLRMWLNSDPYLADDQIQVNVLGGRASLAGTVDSVQEKLHATAIAEGVHGVTSVLNAIQVPAQKGYLAERRTEAGGVTVIPFDDDDARLRDRVRDQILFDPFVRAPRVNVSAEDGTVVLAGPVRNEWDRLRVIENAYQAGALRVVDRITIAP